MVSYLGFLGDGPNRGYRVGSYITEEKIPALPHPTPFAWGGPLPGVDGHLDAQVPSSWRRFQDREPLA